VTYAAITADPPWHEPGGHNRGSNDKYDTLDRADILEAMVRAPEWRPAENCHLYLWTTVTSLLSGVWLMDALGFRYVTHGVWVKSKDDDLFDDAFDISLGQYFRIAHELFLFGVRGKGFAVRSEARSIPSVLVAPVPRENGRRVHSRKPEKFFDMVERRTVGARLEMFARTRRPGWDAFGNELDAQQPIATQET
jgi:N6-adenosine-specific RNA methylase IME4